MRIEKVNDTQIRCTLTKEDLAERHIKLSELAYGSEKAKALFRDMMQQAAFEFGFEADNIPLMIEAIPLSTESIILIITKVEYPEELDTRFSQFSPGDDEDDVETDATDLSAPILEGAEDIMKLLSRLKENAKTHTDKEATESTKDNEASSDKSEQAKPITKLFVLDSMNEVEKVAHVLENVYQGDNELYHYTKNNKYYLFLHRSEHSLESFNKVCNVLSEYALQERFTPATEAFFKEHYKPVISKHALQTISSL
ncbi:MAG: adaptor protein MecA [Lachnospiraceae bacterium]|nr:adaptor protein MecA [Lachnospiraceae bacterium]